VFSTEIDPRVPPTIEVDNHKLVQILVNLLGNAVKFTERGLIAVRVRCPVPGDLHRVRIDVADTGPGIAPEDVPHVFGIFDQVDPSDARRHGGSGLGLSISHRIVDLMGGTLSVDTSVGGGSTFHVEVTLGVALAALPKPDVRALPSLPDNLRILVVEDNIVNQKVALGMLGSLGCKAKVVDSGERALDNFDREAFEVVLMDIQMPEMDGLETTRRIRERVGDGTTPWIIAVTAAAQHEDRQRSLDSGMNDYLAKPVRIEDLQVALSRAVNAVRG
jgi:CheY-like chemotaxis protein